MAPRSGIPAKTDFPAKTKVIEGTILVAEERRDSADVSDEEGKAKAKAIERAVRQWVEKKDLE